MTKVMDASTSALASDSSASLYLPTGCALPRPELKRWVSEHDTVQRPKPCVLSPTKPGALSQNYCPKRWGRCNSPLELFTTLTSMETAARPPDKRPLVRQATLAAPVEQIGIGLHSGVESRVRITPAPADSGRVFMCHIPADGSLDGDGLQDSNRSIAIPATTAHVVSTQLSTELGAEGVTVRTVEHLLAALVAMGVDNARIDISGPEVPLLDGSALVWAEAIAAAGLTTQSERDLWTISRPLSLQDGDAWLAAFPSSECRFTYGIDFDVSAIGNQWFSWAPEQEPFLSAIAPARTFGLAHQIDHLRQHGLIRGGSLDNALVCSSTGWLNPPLRFSNEPVRHKLLDLVGDISLTGALPQAHIIAYRASHRLHVQFAQQLVASAIQTSTLSNILS